MDPQILHGKMITVLGRLSPLSGDSENVVVVAADRGFKYTTNFLGYILYLYTHIAIICRCFKKTNS